MSSDRLEFMGAWFASQCDGDWEHGGGVRIASLDNPGWALDVRIEDTELDGVVVDWRRVDESAESWLHWRATGKRFEARCGPADLSRAFDAFRHFAPSYRSRTVD